MDTRSAVRSSCDFYDSQLDRYLPVGRQVFIRDVYKEVIHKRNGVFQLWQQQNHSIEMSTNEMIDQRLAYVHDNPVEAGFVYKPEDWVWSSARQYAGEIGELAISYV
ncbi:hypothetical protein [Reichenbachiella agariperforans]|nr:hypothetical protein [Reichenbachiella agariperforans]